jgi:hypothetical protein
VNTSVGFDELQKVTGKARCKFCVKLMGLPSCAANGLAEIELDRKSRESKIMWLMVECWYRIVFGCRRTGEAGKAGRQLEREKFDCGFEGALAERT